MTGEQLNIARQMKAWCRRRPWDGRAATMPTCRALRQVEAVADPEARINLLLTLDVGYHASGWWRNADYDACWHLSLSWPDPDATEPNYLDLPADEVTFWARLFFGDYTRWLWHEPGGTPGTHDTLQARQRHAAIQHLRLFVDRDTLTPLLPRGEVYDLTRWTPATPAKVDR